MKKILIMALLLSGATTHAFQPIVSEPAQPYEAMLISNVDPYQQREFLGTLEQFPDMYELVFDKDVEFELQLKQRATGKPYPFTLLMVHVNDDGSVTEVLRKQQEVEAWHRVTSAVLGMTLLETDVYTVSVAPGTYRIEVSTAVNEGNYMLVLGDETTYMGYFNTLGAIFTTQQHFGFTWFRFLLSSYVHYPLGVLLVIGGIVYTWRSRKRFSTSV